MFKKLFSLELRTHINVIFDSFKSDIFIFSRNLTSLLILLVVKL